MYTLSAKIPIRHHFSLAKIQPRLTSTIAALACFPIASKIRQSLSALSQDLEHKQTIHNPSRINNKISSGLNLAAPGWTEVCTVLHDN